MAPHSPCQYIDWYQSFPLVSVLKDIGSSHRFSEMKAQNPFAWAGNLSPIRCAECLPECPIYQFTSNTQVNRTLSASLKSSWAYRGSKLVAITSRYLTNQSLCHAFSMHWLAPVNGSLCRSTCWDFSWRPCCSWKRSYFLSFISRVLPFLFWFIMHLDLKKKYVPFVYYLILGLMLLNLEM